MVDLEQLIINGNFEEVEKIIISVADSLERRNYLLSELEILKQNSNNNRNNEKFKADKYSNLITTTTSIEQSGNEIIIKDISGNQIGIAIDGNEKSLLDLFSTEIYNRLNNINLTNEKVKLRTIITTFNFKFNGIIYSGYVNGRSIEFYAIGNNGQIKSYAMTLKSPDGQVKRIILNNADAITLFFTGLKETFPTT